MASILAALLPAFGVGGYVTDVSFPWPYLKIQYNFFYSNEFLIGTRTQLKHICTLLLQAVTHLSV